MEGAVYALILNALVALLFSVAFAIIRMSYPGDRRFPWFCTAYLLGMMTPLSELGVRFTAHQSWFMATSYLSFLLSIIAMAMGLAVVAGRAPPWRLAGAIVATGVLTRIAIWGGPRDDLAYELAYQAPFAIAAGLGMAIAIDVAKANRSRLWLAVAIAFGFLVVYLLVKPFFANAFGSGATAAAYTSSRYALFSQATGGALIVTVGLLILLIVVDAAMGKTLLESESDALTGIANRRGFERQSARVFADARRTGKPLTIVTFDLDRFKAINDTYGHSAGDAVIRAFADVLRSEAPESAVIARLGGEEFVMLLDRTSQRGAWPIAQAVREATMAMDRRLPPVTVSGGIAERQPGDSLDTVLHRADRWAYAAKNSGRNRICPDPAGASLRVIARNN